MNNHELYAELIRRAGPQVAQEWRAAPLDVKRTRGFENLELSAVADEDGVGQIEGYASVFDSEYIIGEGSGWGWREVFRAGAFTKTLTESNTFVVCQHNFAMPLGNTQVRTATVEADARGLRYAVPKLPDTSWARDMLASIEAKNILGSSIGFRVVKDTWTKPENERDMPLREILEVKLFECSPVTWPASPATSAAADRRDFLEARSIALGCGLEEIRGAAEAEIVNEIRALMERALSGVEPGGNHSDGDEGRSLAPKIEPEPDHSNGDETRGCRALERERYLLAMAECGIN